MEVREVLQQCTVEGNNVKLPDMQLDRKLYVGVKKDLEKIGGKWKGGKVAAFVFPHDPTDLLADIAGGKKRNLKKETQFFPTPKPLAIKMAEMLDYKGGPILEPSAGKGDLLEGLIAIGARAEDVDCIEMDERNFAVLEENYVGPTHTQADFLSVPHDKHYAAIIANPPFTKNQDIDHIKHMYDKLFFGGTLVTLSSVSWMNGSQKKQVAFREWLEEVGAEVEKIPAGTFKKSGTMIETALIKIVK